jgi:multiple antibiotic resistance protein
VDVSAAVITLLLIMDPVGNIPAFLSILKTVSVERRRIVLIREILFAYGVLLTFLLAGNYLLRFLRLEQETLSIAGGIVLFLIALRMIFPREGAVAGGEPLEGEPFLVPLAIPLFAGPSTLAALLLLQQSSPGDTISLLAAVTIAWAIGGAILLSSTFFYRLLRDRGLIAIERLMGMLLVMVAVQMLVNGLKTLLRGPA